MSDKSLKKAEKIAVEALSGSKVLAKAEDGFLSVDNDTVTIVARTAELAGS